MKLGYVAPFLIGSIYLFGHVVKAAENDATLQWKGKPIPPMCFDSFISLSSIEPSKSIDVKKCEKLSSDMEIYETYKYNGHLITTYGFKNEGNKEEGSRPAFVSYYVAGKTDKGYVTEVTLGGGGSGEFSSIVFVDINGDTLLNLGHIEGGDRCNGGIVSLEIVKNKIQKTISATPMDLIDLSYGSDMGLQAYKDLENSAGSCFADVTYLDHKVVNISLNKSPVENKDQDWIGSYKYQKCFNEVFREQIKKKSDLTLSELKKSMDLFFTICVKDSKKDE